MSHIDIIRAWKDEEYRNRLSEAERTQLPENPAGLIELGDTDMESVAGGKHGSTIGSPCTLTIVVQGCCGGGGKLTIRILGRCRV
jgi:mersacidin/lichenicidin family type 2 lantibiotic